MKIKFARVALLLFLLVGTLSFVAFGVAWAESRPVQGFAAAQAPDMREVTAIYVLAFDNDPASGVNLSLKYTETLEAIFTAADEDRRAIILADLSGDGDTHIKVMHRGVMTDIVGLPDATGTLAKGITELNTADGEAIGGFLVWALDHYATPTVFFSYVGHGAPFVPETNIAEALDLDGDNIIPDPMPDDGFLPPLPIHVDTNGAVTDHTDRDVVSPYALRTALQMAVDAGHNPIEVLDLVHCFSSTIEELYEISLAQDASGAPFAQTIVASPSYEFFNPAMLGDALSAATPGALANDLAETILFAYDGNVGDIDQQNGGVDHPRVLAAIETDRLQAVKQAWDVLAYELLQDFPTSKPALQTAYYSESTVKYDTTYCEPPDYTLEPPDALVDMLAFARALGTALPNGDPRQLASNDALSSVGSAVIVSNNHTGEPWFAVDPQPTWGFTTTAGIAIYADFEGMKLPPNEQPALIWQSHWYTDTEFVSATGNPHPYAFVVGGYDGAIHNTKSGKTWADVFDAYWDGQELATSACIPPFPPIASDSLLLPLIRR